jgi:diguanylate cyclase (GGDEF)-like protein/PAS domain S-box-containing protein
LGIMVNTLAEILRFSPPEEQWNWSRQVLESISSGVTVADVRLPDMPLVYMNLGFEQITGYTETDVLGKNCRFLQGAATDQPGVDVLRQAMKKGANVQTVLKNFRKDGTAFWNELYLSPIRDLEGRLTHYAGIQHDVTERVELQSKLEHMAMHDALTGLANRLLLMDRIEQAVFRARRSKRMVGVLFFDLDGFKMVNDTFGHDAGDVMLKTIAKRLQTSQRNSDTVARLGGDEFVVVLGEVNSEAQAAEIMQRLASELSKPMQLSGQQVLPSASFGLALYPRDGVTPDELLRASDSVMYTSKRDRKEMKLI